ncbi:hypothetical protein ACHRVZ_15540 [Flavobacterium sp. FlaQc-57]|uniref:hypothetical protein n=1 Tax=Flavobacterium sp. FlaQc-57 TaxID=3374186 RepID=UPI0037566B95
MANDNFLFHNSLKKMYKKIKVLTILVIIGASISIATAQETLKLGKSPYTITLSTALDVESTTKGFLLPRMTRNQRNAIKSPSTGLQIWCTDCNVSTEPASGQLCIYMGSAWASLKIRTTSILTTGKKTESNKPIKKTNTSATINGILKEIIGDSPIETGIVYRKIINGDFSTLPELDNLTGNTSYPNNKLKTIDPITNEEGIISINVNSLEPYPYYYRTYSLNKLGISYGNTIIFNCYPSVFNTPEVSDSQTFDPKFKTTLNINAGTPAKTITEYGYYTDQKDPPTNQKVILSTQSSLDTLNSYLNSETFIDNPKLNLEVNNYKVNNLGTTQYLRFYVVEANTTIYSKSVSFSPPPNPVTGGSAIATIKSIAGPTNLTIDKNVDSYFTVTFDVTQTGSYAAFIPSKSGATTGLDVATVPAGTFTSIGTKTILFKITGTPNNSIEGNNWLVPGIGSLPTGAINKGDVSGSNGRCYDALYNPTSTSGQGEVVQSPITKKFWMTKNLGASRIATSSSDYFAYGCLYQWGRGNDDHASIKHTDAINASAYYSFSSIKYPEAGVNNSFIISIDDWRSSKNDALWQGISGTNNPCPTGFRVPTFVEFQEEVVQLNITNAQTAWNSILKLVKAGTRTGDNATVYDQGNFGSYWTSTINCCGRDPIRYYFNNSEIQNDSTPRSWGFSIRCIKD